MDTSRIGIVGWFLGGYYAPRAAAFESRFALCVAWGANPVDQRMPEPGSMGQEHADLAVLDPLVCRLAEEHRQHQEVVNLGPATPRVA
ncbi:hypothetical protein [Amycolatopsis balhimycina]|uniref:hypothetical protein n=1 Tax=Amycolatopsis TaxID=1813 RepID=UPI0003674421|nr:hypothetical protein [Amycolatopsis balhimycina]